MSQATTAATHTNSNSAITDWNDEYDNVGHVPNFQSYIDNWIKLAEEYRQNNVNENVNVAADVTMELDISYGPKERNKYDLFLPKTSPSLPLPPKGLFVFVHGGYWYRFDKSYFSHLAKGPIAKGYAVAMPSYTLCPNVKVSDITKEVAASIQAAAERVVPTKDIDIPIVLCGHSAGGHLVTRQLCQDIIHLDNNDISQRISKVISISGVHDLRPILNIVQNETIRLDREEAWSESPALLTPLVLQTQTQKEDIRVQCIVGADERPEFIRQNDLLANIWRGMGMATSSVHVPHKNHFDIIDDLMDPEGLICSGLF